MATQVQKPPQLAAVEDVQFRGESLRLLRQIAAIGLMVVGSVFGTGGFLADSPQNFLLLGAGAIFGLFGFCSWLGAR